MAQAKYNLKVLYSLYQSHQSSSGEFVKAVAENSDTANVPKTYARAVYDRFKKGYIPKGIGAPAPIPRDAASVNPEGRVQLEPEQPTVQPSEITEVSGGDVSVAPDAPNPESQDLKKGYKKMYDEIKTGKPSKPDIEGTPDVDEIVGGGIGEGSEGVNEVTEPLPGGSTDSKYKIAIGELLKMVIVGVNDNLIWQERHLTDDDKSLIDKYSKDTEATFDNLESQDAPWINLLVAGFAVPAIERMDLMPAKIDGLLKFLNKQFNPGKPAYKPPQQETPQATPEPPPETQATETQKTDFVPDIVVTPSPAPTPTTNIGSSYPPNYAASEKEIAWFDFCLSQGYKISPTYTRNYPLDNDAYGSKHVIRNHGDTFGD